MGPAASAVAAVPASSTYVTEVVVTIATAVYAIANAPFISLPTHNLISLFYR